MAGDSYLVKPILVALLAAVIVAGFAAPARAQGEEQVAALVLLAPEHRHQAGMAELRAGIAATGGQATHTFPYGAVIARTSGANVARLSSLAGVTAVFTAPVDPATLSAYGADEQRWIEAWNALIAPPPNPESRTGSPADLAHDALMAPDIPARLDDPDLTASAASAAAAPGYWQTSEFMAGSVAVGIVLLESDGRLDRSTENWTSSEKQKVFNEIVAALNWWADLEPRADLSFVYDDHWTSPLPTRVEPITRPYYDEQYWIADGMEQLGYRDPSYFTRVRDYNNHLRSVHGTDWAFTIFVVDSSADNDGRFSDGMFAYAYLGGPFMVLSYRNDGYGPDNLDAIAAHEIGHTFLALDQYAAAQQPCDRKSGYLDVENQNSEFGGCASNVTSIMRGHTHPYKQAAIDRYARGQIGWRDSDGDGILDPLDTDVAVTITSANRNGDSVALQGTARLSAYPSPSRSSVTINRLTQVQYRVDGGAWINATATDGAFDSTTEGFRFTAASLTPGVRRIEVTAIDSAGNVAGTPASHIVAVFDPIDGGLITELHAPAAAGAAGGPLTIDGVAYQFEQGTIALVEYRVDSGAWLPTGAADGSFDSDEEPFSLTLAGPLDIGTYVVQARATDNTGRVEVNVASYTLEIRRFSVALPIVSRAP